MTGPARSAAVTGRWVRTAHADAWQEEGRLRAGQGGAAADLPGVRVMASGLGHPQWNNGDVREAGLVDLDELRSWYAARGVPWGVRVPAGAPWTNGRFLFRKRLMGVIPAAFVPAPAVPGLSLRPATAEDAAVVAALDGRGFGSDEATARPWIEPHLTAPSATVALAEFEGTPVATGCIVVSDGEAGPCTYVSGVCVVPDHRRRGIAGAVSSWLVHRGLDAGARMAHLHPDDACAARVYRRLGFVEVPGLDIYVDMA